MSKKYKILFTIHSMPIGGAERILCDILKRLDYSIYDITLMLYYKTGELLDSVPREVCVKALYHNPECTLYHRIKERLFHLLRIRRVIDCVKTRNLADCQYDAIVSFCHGHGHMMHSFIFDRTNNNISWIHSDLSVGNWGLPFFENSIKKQEAAYNRMNTIVFVSNEAKNAFHKVFDVNNSVNELVVYNFVNIKEIIEKANIANPYIQKRKFTFINVGRLIPAKNQDRIIKAAKILVDKGYDFDVWIVGDGPLRIELAREIDLNSLNRTVELLGTQANPYNYLNASDCFLLTSHQEGFSIAIAEAFTLGIPVISMRSSGPSELLGQSEWGILIEQDVMELAASMEKIMTDKLLYNFYANRSKERAADFTGIQSMKQIESLLKGELL